MMGRGIIQVEFMVLFILRDEWREREKDVS